MPFTNLSTTAMSALNSLAANVGVIQPAQVWSLSFHTGSLTQEVVPTEILDQVGTWTKEPGRFIYYFETDDVPESVTALHKAITSARETKRAGRAYARLFGPSPVLYVGGSADLKTRVRQHLGYATKTIFAMHMVHWATECDVEVRLTAARYAPVASDDVLGALEDQLWAQMRPMLGRQGRR